MYSLRHGPLYCNCPDDNDDRKRFAETSEISSVESAILIDKVKDEMSRAVRVRG